ncbi:MAG: tetratricopeptide repeat protein [Deltaproteobacteria bacterium]|nr:tetratricopeptide repeat protein [Deltaproteobacteria bacterium]
MKVKKLFFLALVGILLTACATQQAVVVPPPTPPPELTAGDYFNRGLNYFLGGSYDDALREFQSAVQLDPGHLEALYYIGQCYEKRNMLFDAEQAYRRAILINSQFLKAREALGMLLYRQSNFSAAKTELETAAILGSRIPEVYYELGEILLSENNCLKAIEMFERTLQLSSTHPMALDGLKRAKNACGQTPKRKSVRPKEMKQFKGGGQAIKEEDF